MSLALQLAAGEQLPQQDRGLAKLLRIANVSGDPGQRCG